MAFVKIYDPSYHQVMEMATRFKENGIPFDSWRNAILPQIVSVLLAYIVYLSINLVILPSIKRILLPGQQKIFSQNGVKVILAIVCTACLLAIGVNALSYFARPHLFNYRDYQFLALLGYNDKPLTNLFFGFNRAIALVLLVSLFAGFRELIIWLIARPGLKRDFRVLILNNLTPLLCVYLLIPFFVNPVHEKFLDYLSLAPVLALYVYQTFWLFPFKEARKWLQGPVLLRGVLSTFIGAIVSTIIFSGSNKLLGFSMYWLIYLVIITPLNWLLYQQRRDKILQLKGVETALAKSTMDLQFLRSQINPHFLFNALNTLYGTALREKSEQTAEGIQMLGDMMRFMLHENNLDFIPMNKEIAYLKNYISLQKLRTPALPGISLTDNIDEGKCNCEIAPMLLIPFVENAFKHGISLQEDSWIDIRLDCAPAYIRFEVRNSLHIGHGEDTEKGKSGIGLTNVAERLKLLYPGNHQLDVRKTRNEFIATLVIKVKG